MHFNSARRQLYVEYSRAMANKMSKKASEETSDRRSHTRDHIVYSAKQLQCLTLSLQTCLLISMFTKQYSGSELSKLKLGLRYVRRGNWIEVHMLGWLKEKLKSDIILQNLYYSQSRNLGSNSPMKLKNSIFNVPGATWAAFLALELRASEFVKDYKIPTKHNKLVPKIDSWNEWQDAQLGDLEF